MNLRRTPVDHFYTRDRCPACRSETWRTLFARSYAEPKLRRTLEGFYGGALRRDYHLLAFADYVLCRCETCGLIFQQQVPDAFLLSRLYDRWINADEALAAHERNTRLRTRLDLARDTFLLLSQVKNRLPSRRVLDVGCGWGDWVMMAQSFGADAYGTELSSIRRAHCRRRGLRVVASEQELPDRRFHAINVNQVFEHLPDPRVAMETLARKLRGGGIMRIAVPNGLRVEKYLPRFDAELDRPQGGGLYAVAPLEHLCCFCPRSLTRLAEEFGLKRIEPTWGPLLESVHVALSGKSAVKALARPFYLRSRFTTDMFFQKPAPPARRIRLEPRFPAATVTNESNASRGGVAAATSHKLDRLLPDFPLRAGRLRAS